MYLAVNNDFIRCQPESCAALSAILKWSSRGKPSSLAKMADCKPPPSLKFLSNFQKVECARDGVQDVSKAKSKDVFLIQVPSKVSILNVSGVNKTTIINSY